MKTAKAFCTLFSILIISSLSLLLTNSCASISSPTGGPKDTLSPIVVKTIPNNQNLNYKGKIIVLFFSEEVKTKSFNTQLLSTPPLPPYKLKETRNRIEIRLSEPLKDSTTYSLNFREGIVDLTEENIAYAKNKKNLRLAFSTWGEIDTMSVAGNVKDLLTKNKLEGGVVALYPTDDTLVVDKHKPYYFAVTDTSGNFRIDNVKKGSYKAYAIKDANKNYIFDDGESIAFLTKDIDLEAKNMDKVELEACREDHKAPEIARGYTKAEYFHVKFRKGLESVYVDSAQKTKKYAYNLIDKGKVLRFFNTNEIYEDSIAVNIIAIDSSGNRNEIQQKIVFNKPKEKGSRRNKKNKKIRKVFAPKVFLNTGNGIEKNILDMNIKFQLPIKVENLDKITFFPDNDTLNKKQLVLSPDEYEWNLYKTNLRIKKEVKFKEKLNIFLDSLAFINVTSDTSIFVSASFNRKDASRFGMIGGKVATNQTNYIIQLVDEQWKVVREVKNTKAFLFEYLPAGKYSIRVILDENGNGKWDTSDYRKRKAAEKVFIFYQNEKLRENWELPDRNIEF